MRPRVVIIAAAMLGGVILLLLVAGYLALRSLDPDSYRPEILAAVKSATGRDLVIGGGLGIGLDNGLVVRVDDLALGNADWGSRPQMIIVGRAEARLALLPLLFGDVRIQQLRLREMDLLLETDAAGKGNWLFDKATSGEGTRSIDAQSVVVESGRLVWRAAGDQPGGELVISGLDLRGDVEGNDLVLQAGARLHDSDITLSGRIPRLLAWSGGRPLDVDLRLQTTGLEAEVKGTIGAQPWGISPALSLQAKKVEFAALGRLAGRPLPAVPPFDLTFDLSRSEDGWQVANLAARSGGSDLIGELTLSSDGGRTRFSASLSSKEMDLAWLLAPGDSDTPVAADMPAADRGTNLSLDALKHFDGDLRLSLEHMVGAPYGLRSLHLEGRLMAGRLEFKPIKIALVGGGQGEGRFQIDASASSPAWSLALEAAEFPAATLLGPQHASMLQAPGNLRLDLRTRGHSTTQWLNNLSGEARLLVGEGRARLKAVDGLVGGLSALTGQLLEKGSDDAQLNCVIADFAVENGVAQSNVLLIDTAVSSVRGDGKVDLVNRRLDLTFTPQPKKPTLSVAVPVHVRGPFGQPAFIPDRRASVGKIIGIAGLFVYPPAALVTLGELGSTDNPCVGLLRAGKRNELPESPANSLGQGVENAVRGIGRGLKNLFGE